LEKISQNDFFNYWEKKLHLEKHIHPSKNFPIYLFISKFVKGGPKKKKKKKNAPLDHGTVPKETMEAICYYLPK